MKRRKSHLFAWVIVLALVLFPASRVHAQENQVLGEVQFDGTTNVEKTSGVWVDGEYVGYVKELKGSKKILLLPGEHVISVRQNGYQDFVQTVVLQPGQTQIVRVTMDKAATGPMPADDELATIRIDVNPSRAAVFVDERFVGHVGEFGGVGKSMLVVAGAHRIRIALPGYETFETDINPRPRQKVEVKTDLVKSEIPVAEPLLKGETSMPSTSARRRDAGISPQ
ncbi:MAG TPA: PEGA domain-containing protein [Terriglobales bacterium]|nr:PEGA domain-containing protein [Terriglobales bacterium]